MKRFFVSQIRENDSVDDLFLVKSKTLAVGKTGKPYLVVSLMDRTGEMEGRVWDDAESYAALFEADDFVSVSGRVSAYMGKLQMRIMQISRVDDGKVELADFLPASVIPPDEMFSQLRGIVAKVKNRHIRALLDAIFSDGELCRRFKTAPAAKGMHHVYIGGLLEHVLSLCRLIDQVSAHYGERVNRDLLIAGAILHDIGKIRELSYERAFGYTDEGRLLGHITIGVEMLDEKLRAFPDFPGELALLLKHMILSHHGEYEYGSPKRPKTLEATILSYLDDLDAKVNSIQSLMASDGNDGSPWTGYHRLFERYIYKGNCLGAEWGDEAPQRSATEPLPRKEEKKTADGRTLALFGN